MFQQKSNSALPNSTLCTLVKVNSTTVLSIGGQAKNSRSVKKTYFYNSKVNKWTPGVNFTNILCAACTHADPKSAKKILNSSSFLRF